MVAFLGAKMGSAQEFDLAGERFAEIAVNLMQLWQNEAQLGAVKLLATNNTVSGDSDLLVFEGAFVPENIEPLEDLKESDKEEVPTALKDEIVDEQM